MRPVPNVLSRRPALVVAATLLAAAGACSVSHPAAPTGGTAGCVPYRLPGAPGAGRGELITVNDAGMYVGRVRDASDVGRAAWWTHTGPDLSAGWTLHVPDIPATDAEFLDVNAGGDLMKFAETVAINRGLSVRVFSSVSDAREWLLGEDARSMNAAQDDNDRPGK